MIQCRKYGLDILIVIKYVGLFPRTDGAQNVMNISHNEYKMLPTLDTVTSYNEYVLAEALRLDLDYLSYFFPCTGQRELTKTWSLWDTSLQYRCYPSKLKKQPGSS